MFCRKCGAEIPNDSEFCSKCGAKINPPQLKDDLSLPKNDEANHSSLKEKDEAFSDWHDMESSVRVKMASPFRYLVCGFFLLISIISIVAYIHDLFTFPTVNNGDLIVGLLISIVIASICIFFIHRGIKYTKHNEEYYERALENGMDTMPYQEIYKIALRHPVSGLIKRCSVGYSCGMFFFNCWCPLYRGDLKWFAVYFIATLILSAISMGILLLFAGPVFGFFYNKQYIKKQLEKGFVPADDIAKRWLLDHDIINA